MHSKANESGYADALFREADGLALIRKAIEKAGVAGVRVPEVFSVSEDRLEMTKIVPSPPSDTLLRTLGKGLARLHDLPQPCYGFHRDNYIGLNPQQNVESDDWGDFFLNHRLQYQVAMIRDNAIRTRFSKILQDKGALLSEWLNEQGAAPGLIHGDLWSGNVMFDQSSSWLIDPAVYCADPEVDLAMTEMFGGFGDPFYQAYHAIRPRSKAYGRKRDLYNLYHFLNHYNLFGAGYLQQCERTFSVIAAL
jgi:fructosamine-3-kinase